MDRIGRLLAISGALGLWLPFAALCLLGVLAALTVGGYPEPDVPLFAADLVIVVAVPFATWLALRARGVVVNLVLLAIGLGVPWLWAPLIPSSYSAPLHVMATLATLSGAVMAVGGLLMLTGSRPGRGRRLGRGVDTRTP